jgi:hypothetical protein
MQSPKIVATSSGTEFKLQALPTTKALASAADIPITGKTLPSGRLPVIKGRADSSLVDAIPANPSPAHSVNSETNGQPGGPEKPALAVNSEKSVSMEPDNAIRENGHLMEAASLAGLAHQEGSVLQCQILFDRE